MIKQTLFQKSHSGIFRIIAVLVMAAVLPTNVDAQTPAPITKNDLNYNLPTNLIYNAQPQSISVTFNFSPGDDSKIAVLYTGNGDWRTTTPPKNAGTYDVHVGITGGSTYIADTIWLGDYTIAPATLTATANDVTWVRGTPIPVLAAKDVTYSGFVGGHDFHIIANSAVPRVNFSIDSVVFGASRTTLIPPHDKNYTIIYKSGKLIRQESPPQPKTYRVFIGTAKGGTITASETDARAGTAITLRIATEDGYSLNEISANQTEWPYTPVELSGSGSTRMLYMPAYDVTVRASFRASAERELLNYVLEIIENAVFSYPQSSVNTQLVIPLRLITTINNAIAKHNVIANKGFSVSPENIQIISFTPAIEGSAKDPYGTNGTVRFTVSLSHAGLTAQITKTGTIVATTEATRDVIILPTTGGTVKASPVSAKPYENIVLTATPARNYEVESITAYSTAYPDLAVELTWTSPNHRIFVMPYYGVTIKATFREISDGNETVKPNALKATASNGALHVSGLTAGQILSVYNFAGATIYSETAQAAEAVIALPSRGAYIVVSGEQRLKVVY